METTENTTTELVQVKFELPVIPEVLNINGIEVSNDLLLEQEKIADKLAIKDFLDEEGYAAMKDFKGKVLKIRTKSEAFRKEIAKPVNDKLSELKSRTDGFGIICKRIEDKLAPKLEAFENYKEEERKRIAEENKAKAEARAVILVENGMIFNGAGTYRFPDNLDQSVFVLQDELGEMTDDEFEAKLSEVKPIWDAEVERVAKVKADEEKAQLEKDRLIADANEERTEIRKELLEAKGFDYVEEKGYYTNGVFGITNDDILNANKDEWKALLNQPTVSSEKQEVKEETPIVFDHANETVKFEEPAIETLSFDEPFAAETVTFDTVEELEELFDEETEVEAVEAKSEPDYDLMLDFSKEHPFKDSEAVEGFKLRIFNIALEDLAMEGIDQSEDGSVAFSTTIGLLKFALIKA